jgi:hypothetical protein
MIRYILLIIIYFFTLSINAGTILDGIPDEKYIEYAKNIDCVVKIVGKIDNKEKAVFSGVIIDQHWIITAAHTLDNNQKFYFYLEDKQLEINEFFIHPHYNPSEFGSIDIGLCYTKDPIKIKFIPELYTDDNEVGRLCCIVGYGMTGTGKSGAIKWDGKRRAGSNKIINIHKNMLMCDMSSDKPTQLEFCMASGDSGGGLFIDKKLAGINSCVFHDNPTLLGKYNDDSGHIRISNKECIEWIKYIIYE